MKVERLALYGAEGKMWPLKLGIRALRLGRSSTPARVNTTSSSCRTERRPLLCESAATALTCETCPSAQSHLQYGLT